MRPFFMAFAGGFFGKLLAALFIAVCVLLGFGPDTWAAYLVGGLPSWITPALARGAFITLAIATFAAVFGLPILARARARHQWRSVPITESNLAAYIRSSPLVQKLDDQIAQNAKLPIKPDETAAFFEEESAKFFGITDIAKLDTLLEENQEAVLRISSYSFTEEHIVRGASITCLFDVLGTQLGEVGLRALNMLWQLKHITEHGIQNRLNAYREFSKNHKIKVRIPLVPDFNLISIENGLSLVRRRCRRSAFAKSLPKGGSTESELLAYFESLKDKMAFYGSLRDHKERVPLGHWPQSNRFPPAGFLFTPVMLNPRFEAGEIIVDSQLFHNDSKGNLTATDAIYERLYVLRPDLMRAIDQLNSQVK